MSIFQISNNRYAIGTFGKTAEYVVATTKGGKTVGVRGRRPLLNKRYKKVTPTAAVKAAFKAALA
jgi:hypothetical protein